MQIDGKSLTAHPLATREAPAPAPRRYRHVTRGVTVLAALATDFGSVNVGGGDPWQAFIPGDMIVTDDPPTHAWPVAAEVFAREYVEA